MLTWDEEVKPSLPKDMQQGLQHSSNSDAPISRSMELPTSQIAPAVRVLNDGATVAAPTTSAPKTAQPAVTRRVNAADKRIINGQTDVNQLVPFKYKWAW